MNASPESVGMSSERLARIGPAIAPYIGDDKIAGAVTLVARRGKIVYLQSVGVLDRETRQPMCDDAIFRIFSMTKPITCVALMMLYEQGRFQLTTPVSKWIPAFGKMQVYAGGTRAEMKLEPLNRPVTVRDLLTHTSGLTDDRLNYGPVEELYREVKGQGTPLAEFVKAFADLPLAFQPGAAWRYSHAHDVVAHLVELISGQPFDVYLRESILPHCMAPIRQLAKPTSGCLGRTTAWNRPHTTCSAAAEAWSPRRRITGVFARCCSTTASWRARVCWGARHWN
jgi:CubicO group peptidase (beta-lactamase class C family)